MKCNALPPPLGLPQRTGLTTTGRLQTCSPFFFFRRLAGDPMVRSSPRKGKNSERRVGRRQLPILRSLRQAQRGRDTLKAVPRGFLRAAPR